MDTSARTPTCCWIYILLGEVDKAIDLLEPLLGVSLYLPSGRLPIDPTFDPLHCDSRLRRPVNASYGQHHSCQPVWGG